MNAPAPVTETPIRVEDVRRQSWTTDIDATTVSPTIADLQRESKASTAITSADVLTPTLRYYLSATGAAPRLPLTVSGHWMALAVAAGLVASIGVPVNTPTPYIQLGTRAVAPLPDMSVSSPIYRSASFRKFKDVALWLGLSDETTAELLGVGRTTPYSWERRGAEPRPSHAGRLFEYHALLSSVVRRLGPSGLQDWLVAGSPRPRQLLLSGNLAAAYDIAHDLVFTRGRPEMGLGALQPETQVAPPQSAGMATTDEIKRSVRRSRKLRV